MWLQNIGIVNTKEIFEVEPNYKLFWIYDYKRKNAKIFLHNLSAEFRIRKEVDFLQYLET